MINETTAEHTFNQPQYWLLWVLSNVTSWLVWAMLNFGLLAIASSLDTTNALGPIIPIAFFLVVGALLGVTQWWVLRRQVPMTTRWILFTAIGFAVGVPFDLIFAGLGVGVMQWLLLRNVLNKSSWWPVITAVAWPVGYMIGSVLGSVAGQAANSIAVMAVVTWGASGAIVGAITGAVLMWMLRENRALLDDLQKQRAEAKA